jgi:branched-chain amino acid transport system permease protein
VDTVQVLVLGLLLGGVYALMAMGLTLLFGVMRVVNLAHGAFIILAAYIAWIAFQRLGIDPFLSVPITMALMFLLGVFIYSTLFPRVVASPRYVEMTVLLTFAVALITEGVMGYFFTGIYRSLNPPYATEAFLLGPIFIPKGQLYASLLSVGLLLALGAFLRFTRTGYAIRATMQNRSAAQIVGVNVQRVSTIAFGIGLALAGASGSMMSFLFTFFPAAHWRWIAILLSLIVLGGLGSLAGALVGALTLGVASSYVSSLFGPTWSPLTFFIALFLILLVRKEGLFGKKVVEA